MLTTQDILQAIEVIRDELPVLVGNDWEQFERQLAGLLKQLEAEAVREPITRAQILSLFSRYPEAHKRLTGLLATPETIKGVSTILMRLLHRPVTRYTDIACPGRVWLQTPRVPVVVRLTVRSLEHSAVAEELAVREGLPVRVRVTAPAFEVLNVPEQETQVLPEADSPPVVFDLRPREVGPTRLSFDFFQSGNPVGTASVSLEVTAALAVGEGKVHGRQPLRVGPTGAPPDLLLYVIFERFREQPALQFTLFRAGEVGRTFHPVPLQGDPAAQALRLYDGLTQLASHIDPTTQAILGQQRVLPAADVDRKLKRLGQNLWKMLLPEELKVMYATERAIWGGKSLLIVSDEPYIPWELVWPYDADGGWEDEAPWCVRLRLTRWLRRDAQGNGHEGPPAVLHMGALACLIPTNSGLPAAQAERAFLADYMQRLGLVDRSPDPPSWGRVQDLLEHGGYDWLHVGAHGNFQLANPDADSAIWLQDERPLTPGDLVGSAIERHIRRNRPGFVFNACHSGRQAWALTGLGGWANRLISAGAGLFLAPLWTVDDDRALDFAKTFYRELWSGQTVSEAVLQARLAARREGDPTWLAYSIYAHPHAQLPAGTPIQATR